MTSVGLTFIFTTKGACAFGILVPCHFFLRTFLQLGEDVANIPP